MLKIQGLHKKYGNYHALDGLDMELKDGALFGFVGPNGAGKTTTIKSMTGLLKPDRGTVELDGKICWPTPWACVCGSAMCRITLACMTI